LDTLKIKNKSLWKVDKKKKITRAGKEQIIEELIKIEDHRNKLWVKCNPTRTQQIVRECYDKYCTQ